jgi:membrane protein implicated in regulation of membrane protease activity
MIEFMISLGVWNWFIAGAVLLLLELLMPGVFMLWLGIAAIVTGALSFAIGWSWQAQFIAFAVISLVLVPLWLRVSRRSNAITDQPFLNRRNVGLVGRGFTLEKPIVNGAGTIRIDDTIWRIAGPELPAGSRVKVVRADGAELWVEPVES